MSIWSELLFLHGHLTRPTEAQSTAAPSARSMDTEDADRLRELLGCRSVANRDQEPRGPLLGVRGLS
ncbi:MAG: hypothetical protein ACXWLI_07520 [Myxococcaceae bacterium]